MLTTVGQIRIVSDNPQSAMNKVNSWLILDNVYVDICKKYRMMAPCYDDKLYIIEIKFRNIDDTETRDIVLPKERTFDRWDESTYS